MYKNSLKLRYKLMQLGYEDVHIVDEHAVSFHNDTHRFLIKFQNYEVEFKGQLIPRPFSEMRSFTLIMEVKLEYNCHDVDILQTHYSEYVPQTVLVKPVKDPHNNPENKKHRILLSVSLPHPNDVDFAQFLAEEIFKMDVAKSKIILSKFFIIVK